MGLIYFVVPLKEYLNISGDVTEIEDTMEFADIRSGDYKGKSWLIDNSEVIQNDFDKELNRRHAEFGNRSIVEAVKIISKFKLSKSKTTCMGSLFPVI